MPGGRGGERISPIRINTSKYLLLISYLSGTRGHHTTTQGVLCTARGTLPGAGERGSPTGTVLDLGTVEMNARVVVPTLGELTFPYGSKQAQKSQHFGALAICQALF